MDLEVEEIVHESEDESMDGVDSVSEAGLQGKAKFPPWDVFARDEGRVHLLIKLYEDNPCLWNTTLKSYKSSRSQAAVKQTIASTLNLTVKEVSSRIIYLRASRRTKIALPKTRSGQGVVVTSANPRNEWWINELSFLDAILRPSHTFDNMSNQEAVSVDQTSDGSRPADDPDILSNPVTQAVTVTNYVAPVNPQLHNEQDQIQLPTLTKTKKSTGPVSTPTSAVASIDMIGRRRNPQKDTSAAFIEAAQSLISAAAPTATDEYDAYGQYIACELRKMTDKKTIALTKLKIQQVLTEAEFGELSGGVNNFQHSSSSYHQTDSWGQSWGGQLGAKSNGQQPGANFVNQANYPPPGRSTFDNSEFCCYSAMNGAMNQGNN